jgi:hypothetical protein
MSKARDLANAGTALTTVSATELGYLDGVTSAVQTQINAKEATLPSQTGNTGKYLTTDGSAKSWGTVSQYALPTQTGNSGKYLTTNGTAESWGTVATGSMTLLSTTTLSGASTTISSINQTYTDLLVFVNDLYISSSNDYITVRPNAGTDNGLYAEIQNNTTSNSSEIKTSKPSESSSGLNSFVIKILQYSNTSFSKPTTYYGVSKASTGDNFCGFGAIVTTSAITSMQFVTAGYGATFSGGTVLIYGVK